MISAWASGQRLVLGQRPVADKANGITAIPELLALLSLKGAIVTVDGGDLHLDAVAPGAVGHGVG